MSGVSYPSNYYHPMYNATPRATAATATAATENAGGGFVSEVVGGSASQLAFLGLINGSRYITNHKAAIESGKITNQIYAELEAAKTLTRKQSLETYNLTKDAVYKALKKGKTEKFVNSFGTHTAQKAVRTMAASSAAATAEVANTASLAGKAWKTTKNVMKKGGFKTMAWFGAAIEAFTEVIPAFRKGGIWEGIKQIGKSAVKVVADAGGWALGAVAGAKIGAAIGSIIPGAGTIAGLAVGSIIGTVCGLVGSIAGSLIGNKTAKAIVGKSFSEKQAETQQQVAQTPQYQPSYNLAYSRYSVPGYSTIPSFGVNPLPRYGEYSYLRTNNGYIV